jgi:hypothetical protein
MPEPTIENDATIAGIIDDLNTPEEYVRRVLEHMEECWRQHGAASVRIGVIGKGRAPNYRIEYPNPQNSWQALVFNRPYRGLGHKEMRLRGMSPAVPIDIFAYLEDDLVKPDKPPPDDPPDDPMMIGENWSSRDMSLDEIKALLGNLRPQR